MGDSSREADKTRRFGAGCDNFAQYARDTRMHKCTCEGCRAGCPRECTWRQVYRGPDEFEGEP